MSDKDAKTDEGTPEVTIRRGEVADVPALQEFTKNTFAWGDYVADSLYGWLEEPGHVMVASVQGRPVGVNHVHFLSKTDVWFEGIRVHPDFRGRGIGGKLTAASIEEARRGGFKVCRAGIDSDNYKSQSMSAAAGFRKVRSIHDYYLRSLAPSQSLPSANGLDTAGLSVHRLSLEDVEAVSDLLIRSLTYVGVFYSWQKATREAVIQNVEPEGELYVVKDRDGAVLGGGFLGEFETGPDVEDDGDGAVASMANLGSVFGNEVAMLAMVRYSLNEVIKRRDAASLSTAKLWAASEQGHSAGSLLEKTGFKRHGREYQLWELEL